MKLYTQADAARLLGITRQAVNDALKRGALRIAKNASGSYLFRRGRPLITADELERYRLEVQRRPA